MHTRAHARTHTRARALTHTTLHPGGSGFADDRQARSEMDIIGVKLRGSKFPFDSMVIITERLDARAVFGHEVLLRVRCGCCESRLLQLQKSCTSARPNATAWEFQPSAPHRNQVTPRGSILCKAMSTADYRNTVKQTNKQTSDPPIETTGARGLVGQRTSQPQLPG